MISYPLQEVKVAAVQEPCPDDFLGHLQPPVAVAGGGAGQELGKEHVLGPEEMKCCCCCCPYYPECALYVLSQDGGRGDGEGPAEEDEVVGRGQDAKVELYRSDG